MSYVSFRWGLKFTNLAWAIKVKATSGMEVLLYSFFNLSAIGDGW